NLFLALGRGRRLRAARRALCRNYSGFGSGILNASIVDVCKDHNGIMAGSFAFQQSKTILARSGDVERASGEYLTDQREVAATGCICFFGQIRTLELRNSARFVQTA